MTDKGAKTVSVEHGQEKFDFVRIVRKVIVSPPLDWTVSRDCFNSLYQNNILNDENGWDRQTVDRVFKTLLSYEKKKGVPLTDTLLAALSKDPAATEVMKTLVDLVKVCDVNAYQQDHNYLYFFHQAL